MSLLRSAGIVYSPDDFPPLAKFLQTNLPTWHEVIRRFVTITSQRAGPDKKAERVCHEVSLEIEQIYVSHTVYCVHISSLNEIVLKKYNEFYQLRHSFSNGSPSVKKILLKKEDERSAKEKNKAESWQNEYKVFLESLKECCAVKTEDKTRLKSQEDLYGVKMTKDEDNYYEMQKQKDRRWVSDKTVDPKWIASKKKEASQKKYQEKQKEELKKQFEFASTFSDSDEHMSDDEKESDVNYVPDDDIEKRPKRFCTTIGGNNLLPESMRYVRQSERKVSPDFYECMQSLCGIGFSTEESMKAFVIVSNIFYKNSFKMPEKNQESYDRNTLPNRTTVLNKLQLGEVKRLDMISKKIESLQQEKEKMLTWAQDSTTRKQVGTYSVSGLHFGKELVIPLPTLSVTSETAANVADTHSAHLEILAAASGTSASELYQSVDCHMTDSVSHNKRIGQDLAEKYGRDEPAGQVFCNIHTSLGISRAVNTSLAEIEAEMGIENIFKSVLVEVSYDKKHGSVVAQAVHAFLALIDAEHSAKTWNKHADFVVHLKSQNKDAHFFQYRDDRFDGLAHGCALVLHLWETYFSWLKERSDINNRLACYVRSMENVSYLQISLAVFAAFGIQLIEPFNATMFSNKTTHTNLITFYSSLMDKLNEKITDNFFSFDENAFGFSNHYFQGCKDKYHIDLVKRVSEVSTENIDDCVKLANFILPSIKKTIISQRGGEYGFGGETSEFPVEEQARNIDDVPHHNLQMESYCGRAASLVNKLGTLEAASRSMIFHGTENLTNEFENKSLGSFRKRLELVKSVKLEWSERQKQLLENGLSQKQAQLLQAETFKNKLLRTVKDFGGPFTCAEEIDLFVKTGISHEQKQKRMKAEVQYFRETCLLFDKSNVLFKIMNVVGSSRKTKTVEQLAHNLKLLFGKTTSQDNDSPSTLSLFRDALDKRLQLRIELMP